MRSTHRENRESETLYSACIEVEVEVGRRRHFVSKRYRSFAKRKDFQIISVCETAQTHTHTRTHTFISLVHSFARSSHIICMIFVTFVFICCVLMRERAATNKYDGKKAKIYTNFSDVRSVGRTDERERSLCTYVYLIRMICSSYYFVGWHDMRTSSYPLAVQLNAIDKRIARRPWKEKWDGNIYSVTFPFGIRRFAFIALFLCVRTLVQQGISFFCCCSSSMTSHDRLIL